MRMAYTEEYLFKSDAEIELSISPAISPDPFLLYVASDIYIKSKS